MMRSWRTLRCIWVRAGGKARNMVLMAWIKADISSVFTRAMIGRVSMRAEMRNALKPGGTIQGAER